MDVKVYKTTSPGLTTAKKIIIILILLALGVLFYFAPSRYSTPTNPALNLIFAVLVTGVLFAVLLFKKNVIQISINPTQNKIESLYQNFLNQQSTVVQSLNQVTTECFSFTDRSKTQTLVIKDQKNIVRLTDKEGYTIQTLMQIQQTIDGYNSKV